jgi:pimeloyl-ACP methyl ester carboxylesterase
MDMHEAARLETAACAPRSLAAIEAEALSSRTGLALIDTPNARIRVRSALIPGVVTVVLLPDGPNIIEHYDPVFERLAGRLGVLALEIPGFGFSYASSPNALTFQGCLDECVAAIKGLNLGDLIVTGPCVQAYIAVGIAVALRKQTRGVVAMQATDVAGERRWLDQAIDPRQVLRKPGDGQKAWADLAFREKMAVDTWYPAAAGPDFDVADWQKTARWAIRAGCSYALPTLCQTWLKDGETLPAFTGKSTVIFGEADRSHAACGSDPAGLKTILPNANIIILERAGHFPDLEDIDAFISAINEFAPEIA